MEGCPLRWQATAAAGAAGAALAATAAPAVAPDFVRMVSVSPDGGLTLALTDQRQAHVYSLGGDLTRSHYYQYTDAATEGIAAHSPMLLSEASSFRTAETVCDFAWHPLSQSADPEAIRIALTMRDHPIHLVDIHGNVRSSFRPHNHLDELDQSQSLAFHPSGQRLYAGGEKRIRWFEMDGYGEGVHFTHSKDSFFGQRGLISCLAFNPDLSGAYSAGCFDGSVSIYADGVDGSVLDIANLGFQLTQTVWSPCGRYLFVGGRKHGHVHCWDIRGTKREVGAMEVRRESQQRMAFALDPWGRHLAAGDDDGYLNIFDAQTFALVRRQACAEQAVNSVAFHPYCAVALVGTGSRQFELSGIDSDSSSGEEDEEDVMQALRKKQRRLRGDDARRGSEVQVWGLPFCPIPYPSADSSAADTLAMDSVVDVTAHHTPTAEDGELLDH